MSTSPSSKTPILLIIVVAVAVAGGVGLLVGSRIRPSGQPSTPRPSEPGHDERPAPPAPMSTTPPTPGPPPPFARNAARDGGSAIAADGGTTGGPADKIRSEAANTCAAVAADLLAGGTLDGRAAATLRDAHKDLLKSLEPFANDVYRCAAVLDDDDKRCNNVPESSRDGCVLEWALFHDGRRGSGSGALFAEGMMSFCRRYVGTAESCAALGEAVRSGDPARCPADKKAACEALARREESGCGGDKGCLHLVRALSLIQAGGAAKLAAGGDDVDKELGAAAQGDKKGCGPVLERFSGKCVEYVNGLVQSTAPKPAAKH